jgi:hypothetical protein
MAINFGLWFAQVALAGLFAMAGAMKTFMPMDKIGEKMKGMDDLPGMTRFIGFAELAGALGMILPMLTGILPWLTPLAALGFAAIQVLAIAYHARRNELGRTLPMNLVLLAVSVFVMWGRFGFFTSGTVA